jgi:hypothetical protein
LMNFLIISWTRRIVSTVDRAAGRTVLNVARRIQGNDRIVTNRWCDTVVGPSAKLLLAVSWSLKVATTTTVGCRRIIAARRWIMLLLRRSNGRHDKIRWSATQFTDE